MSLFFLGCVSTRRDRCLRVQGIDDNALYQLVDAVSVIILDGIPSLEVDLVCVPCLTCLSCQRIYRCWKAISKGVKVQEAR